MTVLSIEQRRGGALEAVHAVDVAVCDREGRLIAALGDDMVTTFRSAAKPFQLEVSLSLLSPALRSLLGPRDLALGAASHHGEPLHVAQVESLLARLDRTSQHLYCGAHAPTHVPSAEALIRGGRAPTSLHNNCSGKHSFMAAASRSLGTAEDYRPSAHPLQARMLANLQARTGGAIASTVVDGCGVPCFVLPLSAMARAWASMAAAMAEEAEPLGEVGRAMQGEPLMMSGSDAFDGWLVQNSACVAKIGAQGLLCMALPEQGLGLALKVRTGSDVVRPLAAWSVLNQLFPGLVRAELPERYTQVHNLVGTRVGEHVAVWR